LNLPAPIDVPAETEAGSSESSGETNDPTAVLGADEADAEPDTGT
jgi:hypothetical protein